MTTPILVGSNQVEITPPLEVGILMSSVQRRWAAFEGIRLPLYARTLMIEQAGVRVALVALDLLGLAGRAWGGKQNFYAQVVAASAGTIDAHHLILTATHTHSAPDSLALTSLYRTRAFQRWRSQLTLTIGESIRLAAKSLQPATYITAKTQAAGLSIYRRIKTTQGILLSNQPPPPEIVISRAGPVDDSVWVSAFLDQAGKPLALLVNATCHPVYEMCIPQISPDYPGEMSLVLEERYAGAPALFLNGAAGNINPPTVSSAADHARAHGQALAQLVVDALSQARPAETVPLRVVRRPFRLPARKLNGQSGAKSLRGELSVLRLGDSAYLFSGAELFVETGLAVRAASPFPFTAIVGYAEDYIGYIPTDEAFDEGGYEVGPGLWSRADRGSEAIVRQAAVELLNEAAT